MLLEFVDVRLQVFCVHLFNFQVVNISYSVMTHILQFISLVDCILDLLGELLNRPFKGTYSNFESRLMLVGLHAVRLYFGKKT